MNAIELANQLDNLWDKSFRNPIISHSADMLRQQAKEIEELKEDLKNRNINIEYLKEKLIASISKQSLVEDLNDMHIARSIQKARDHRKFGENK